MSPSPRSWTRSEWARYYARHGWHVFPLKPRAKEPLTAHGFQDATADGAQVARWWTESPEANIGLHPGPSGFVVIDVDGPEGRAAAVPLGLFSEPTLTARTARGVHLYFAHPGFPVSNKPLAPHVDVRADEGYVVLPPSVHPSGARYRWEKAAVLTLPADVLPRLRNGTAPSAAPALPAVIPEGQRHSTLVSLAGTMGRRAMSERAIRDALAAENAARCQPSLPDAEVEHIARWAASAKSATPYTPRLAPFKEPAPALDEPPKGAKGANTGLAPLAVSVLLADVRPEPVAWLWPGRIPIGKLTMLDGDPGLGKSTLALDLAARLTTGRLLPDGAPLALGSVVLLTAEDGLADTVRPRLDAMGGDPARVVAVQGVADERGGVRALSLPDHLDALRQEIARTNATLVIIDPFMAYLGSYINSRIDHDVRRSLAPLAALAEETRVAVVLIRHLNKAVGGPALYRGGGSIGLIGAARSGLLVADDPDDPTRRVLAVVKANLAARAPSLAYHIESAANGVARVVWSGASPHTASALLAQAAGPEERSALDEAKAFLLDELHDGPQQAVNMRRAASQAGVADITLRRARQALGVVVRRVGFGGPWSWSLPPIGAQKGRRCSSPGDEHLRGGMSTYEGDGVDPPLNHGDAWEGPDT